MSSRPKRTIILTEKAKENPKGVAELGITTGRQNPYGLRVWVCRVRVGVVIEPPA